MPAFRRARILSDVACNGGVAVAELPDAVAISPVYDIAGDEQCTVSLPATSPAYAELREKRVLEITRRSSAGVETKEEWRIADREDSTGQESTPATVVARSLLLELGEVIISTVQIDGTVSYLVTVEDLTLAEAIDAICLPALAAKGKGWFTRGALGSTARFSYEGDAQSVLSVLRAWTEKLGLELDVVRNGTTSYDIVAPFLIGETAPTPFVETRKNLVSTTRSRSTAEQATRVIPRGVDMGAARASIAEVRWLVTGVDSGTSRITIADELGIVLPIRFDDQLNTWLIFRELTGRTISIVDTLKATQQLQLADLSTIAVGERISLRVSDAGTNILNWRPPLQFTGVAALYYASAVNGGTLRVTLKDSVGGAGGQIAADDQMVDWLAVFSASVFFGSLTCTSFNAPGQYYQLSSGTLTGIQAGDICFIDFSTNATPSFGGVTPLFQVGTVVSADNTAKRIYFTNRYNPGTVVPGVTTNFSASIRVYRPTVSHLVRRSYAATDEIALAAVTSVAVNQLIEIRQPCGGVLPSYLDAPLSIAAPTATPAGYGIVEKFVDRPGLRGETNLVPNPFMRTWSGASNVPPDGWTLVTTTGTPTIARITDPQHTDYGGKSALVLLRDALTAAAGSLKAPAFRVWRVGTSYRTTISQRLRVKFVALSGDATLTCTLRTTDTLATIGTPKVLHGVATPNASVAVADKWPIDTWHEIAITATDVSAAPSRSPLELVLTGAGTGAARCELYVDVVQATQTDYDPGVFVEAAEAVALCEEGNRYLEEFADPATEYAVELRDLARLDGGAWDADTIVKGGRLVLRDTQLGILSYPRVVRYAPNELDPYASTVVLSTRMKWLSRIIADLAEGTTGAPVTTIPVGKLSTPGVPAGQTPVAPGDGGPPVWGNPVVGSAVAIQCEISNFGSVIAAGDSEFIQIPFAIKLNSLAELVADLAGDISITVLTSNYGTWGTWTDITSGAPLVLVGQSKSQLGVGSWNGGNLTFPAGTYFMFRVTGLPTLMTKVLAVLPGTRQS